MILGVLLFAASCLPDDTISFNFENFQDMKDQGQEGRLPSFVPSSATQINLQLDVDTKRQWVRFKAGKEAMNVVLMNSKQLTDSEKESLGHYNPTRDVDWWFSDLRGVDVYLVNSEFSRSRYITYVAKDDNYYYIISGNT